MAEVDHDAPARHAVGAKNSIGTPERVGHDRQPRGTESHVADQKAVDMHRGYLRRAGDAPQHHLARLIRRQAQLFGHVRVDAGMIGTGVEHQAKWTAIVDVHGRPDAANAIAPRGSNETWLGRLDDDLGQLLGGLFGRRRVLHLDSSLQAAPQRQQRDRGAADQGQVVDQAVEQLQKRQQAHHMHQRLHVRNPACRHVVLSSTSSGPSPHTGSPPGRRSH